MTSFSYQLNNQENVFFSFKLRVVIYKYIITIRNKNQYTKLKIQYQCLFRRTKTVIKPKYSMIVFNKQKFNLVKLSKKLNLQIITILHIYVYKYNWKKLIV